MPIYEYQCAQCGHQFEILQKVSDEPLRHCDACGEEALTKLISATNFQLKGTGWYKTPPTEGRSGGDKSSVLAPAKGESTSTSDAQAGASGSDKASETAAANPAGVTTATAVKTSKDD